MKGKKDINEFFKDNIGDFRMAPPKKIKRELLITVILGKLFSGYWKYLTSSTVTLVVGGAIAIVNYGDYFFSDKEGLSENERAELVFDGKDSLNHEVSIAEWTADQIKGQQLNSKTNVERSYVGDIRDLSRNNKNDQKLNVESRSNLSSETTKKGGKDGFDRKITRRSFQLPQNEESKGQLEKKNSDGFNVSDKKSNSTTTTSSSDSENTLMAKSTEENRVLETNWALKSDNKGHFDNLNEVASKGNSQGLNNVENIPPVTEVIDSLVGSSNETSAEPVKVLDHISELSDPVTDSIENQISDGYKVGDQTPVVKERDDKLNIPEEELKSPSVINPDSVDVSDTTAQLYNDSLTKVKIDSMDNEAKKEKVKLSYVVAPFFEVDAILNKVDSSLFSSTFMVGTKGGVSYKNNLFYTGLAYQRMQYDQDFTYLKDSIVANYRTRYEYTSTQEMKIDTSITTGDSSWIVFVYDTTYAEKVDSSPVMDTLYSTEKVSDKGKRNITIEYLSVPLLYARNFQFGKHGIELSAGVMLNFLMNNNPVNLFESNADIEIPEYAKVSPESMYINYNFSAGYGYRIIKTFEVFAEITWKGVNKNPIDNGQTKVQYVGGGIGVKWTFD